MVKKFLIWLLATFVLATVALVEAQQPTKVYRIGYLWYSRREQGQGRL